MNNKILTLLGFAAKAGKLSFGYEAAVGSVKAGKSRLVLTAEDISPKTLKETLYFAEKFGVEHIAFQGIDIKTVSDAVGRKCGILSVNDKGFAESMVKLIKAMSN